LNLPDELSSSDSSSSDDSSSEHPDNPPHKNSTMGTSYNNITQMGAFVGDNLEDDVMPQPEGVMIK